MAVIGIVCVRNEADRYLQAVLSWHRRVLDSVFVFDDQSSDHSRRVAADAGCTVRTRLDRDPPFLQHEGRFRTAAWKEMLDVMEPERDDWIVSFDADEFLMGSNRKQEPQDARRSLNLAISDAIEHDCTTITLRIPEVFERSSENVKVRVDGFWGSISGHRICRADADPTFDDLPMGCGSVPLAAIRAKRHKAEWPVIMHFGYAEEVDRRAKYERYSKMRHGHNDKHIQSILKPPKLKDWV